MRHHTFPHRDIEPNKLKNTKICFHCGRQVHRQIYSSSSTILVPRPLSPSGGDLSDSDQREELLLGVFLIIPLACDPDADTPWDAADTTAPDVLVELHVDPDICGAHRLLCKLPDLLDGVGSLLLEGAAAHQVSCQLLINYHMQNRKNIIKQEWQAWRTKLK